MMKKPAVSCAIAVDGSILDVPAHIVLGSENGKAVFGGDIHWGGRSLADAVSGGRSQFTVETRSLACALLPDCRPQKLSVSYRDRCFMLSLEDDNICFRMAKESEQTELLFSFVFTGDQTANTDFVGIVTDILKQIAGFFGIQEFIFYANAGGVQPRMSILGEKVHVSRIPSQIKDSTVLLWAQASFAGDSLFCRGVRALFGIRSTELYLGIAGRTTTCMASLGGIRTGFAESDSLYLLVSFGQSMQFLLRGTFTFPFLEGMEFTVECGMKADAFRMEAFAHVEQPVALFGPCAIGDTCLMVQMGKGLEFGLYSSLYIRNIQMFGAVMLKAAGSVVTPTLLSAAISDISIPILADNLLGEHVNGIEALDFIKILGLPFHQMDPFPREWVEKKDVHAIVSRFNDAVAGDVLELEENQVQLTPFGGGCDLTDLQRMRHYFINKTGELQLAAQFYIALENTTLGNYTVERGYFICGTIEIFRKQFQVLFSFRESEGLLAYAKIPAMDLGFLKIGPSEFQKSSATAIPISGKSLLAQFVDPGQEGIVFFLSAGKNEVSFYLDGSVEVLKLFRLDARIIYMGRNISVDLHTRLYGIFGISMHLLVDYNSFSSGKFEFSFLLDTSGLTEKLTAVTEKINGAIRQIREKIDNAKREVNRAQNHVNELYGQISYFDRKIEQCKRDISRASWWKKAFVAIAKGVEIGAYEVAKIGIYTAIGVATAALEVAKGILSLSGKIGESVLQAVNTVIQGAMSLFYINYIKLETKADAAERYFRAEIDFVVLGKKYHCTKEIGKDSMQQDSAGALSGAINSHIDSDLKHIEDGSFRSSWRKYQYQSYTVAQNSKYLEMAREHVDSSVKLMKSMQDAYVKGLQIPLEESTEMNVSLIKALDQVENVLETGMEAGNVAAFGPAMGALKRSMAAREKRGAFRSGELQSTKVLIEKYDEARGLYDEVRKSLQFIRRKKIAMETYNDAVYRKAKIKKALKQDASGQMGAVLLQVEEQMYEAFPVNRGGKELINLSREGAIQKYFIEAEKQLGVAPGEQVQAMRGRSRKGDYQSRL